MIDSAQNAATAGGSPLPSREKLIEAAARVYAAAGFRGATTRRIAEEAGVNEVTIFRLFGSKAALIDAAIQHQAAVRPSETVALPEVPRHPAAELTAWCQTQLEMLRERRSFIRQEMGELTERPPAVPCASRALNPLAVELKRYMKRLHDEGFVEGAPRRGGRDEEAHAAGAMLLAALFGDVMGRDMMPEMYPQPPERAAALYVGLFLRAIRCAP
jgi:AcrR family transcriptional regulator